MTSNKHIHPDSGTFFGYFAPYKSRCNMSVRILSVVFDTPIEPWELPALRGAIARKAGYEHEHFHNHDGQGDKMHYGYWEKKTNRFTVLAFEK